MNYYINIQLRVAALFALFSIFSCYSNHTKSNNNQFIEIDSLNLITLKGLIGKQISEIKLSSCYHMIDTIFEAEDSTIWPGFIVLKDDEVLFFIETSWHDTLIISSVTISSPQVLIRDCIHVNSKFMEIRDHVSKDLPLGPDGYFYLKDKYDNNIHYYFNFDIFENRIFQFDSIPNEIRVGLIMIR